MTQLLLRPLQRARSWRKATRIVPWISGRRESPLRLLDLGSGEGYVGEALGTLVPAAEVTLADVVDFNQTELPFYKLEPGAPLPFASGYFDVAVLYFVLHHARDAEAVLCEASRVAEALIVTESVYRGALQHRLLRALDVSANSLRSKGAMDTFVQHRTHEEWLRLFASHGLEVLSEMHRGTFIHRQAYYLLKRG